MPRTNPKRLVADGYDRIAQRFLDLQRAAPPSGRKQAYLEQLTAELPEGARVLDLGCGAGQQVAWLSERFRAVGVDISAGQLALARRRAPDATFLLADMSSLQLAPASFDAIAAFYSIIHVPREEHAPLLANLHRFLKPGGRLLVVLGANRWEGTEDNWLDFGAEMYWSHFDAEAGLSLLRDASFIVEQSSIEPDTLIGEGYHLFVIARKAGMSNRASGEPRG